MGCVACINKIDSSLRSCTDDTPSQQIVEASSWLLEGKGGSARLDVFIESEDDLDTLSQKVVNAIEGAGFDGSIVTDLRILPESN
ncbi:MAG: hypothetical protein SGILL_009134 [Bacillariaceae sp.]